MLTFAISFTYLYLHVRMCYPAVSSHVFDEQIVSLDHYFESRDVALSVMLVSIIGECP